MKNSTKDQDWDYIVIGAGLNGLAISSLLAKDCNRVLLLESESVIGGRLKVIEKDGFILDNTTRNLLNGKIYSKRWFDQSSTSSARSTDFFTPAVRTIFGIISAVFILIIQYAIWKGI